MSLFSTHVLCQLIVKDLRMSNKRAAQLYDKQLQHVGRSACHAGTQEDNGNNGMR